MHLIKKTGKANLPLPFVGTQMSELRSRTAQMPTDLVSENKCQTAKIVKKKQAALGTTGMM